MGYYANSEEVQRRLAAIVKDNDRLTVEQVAIILGVSSNTVDYWYRWAKLYPDHPIAKLLPPYSQSAGRQPRYWTPDAIEQFIVFRSRLPRGRGGILGSVTQKWARRQKEMEEAQEDGKDEAE